MSGEALQQYIPEDNQSQKPKLRVLQGGKTEDAEWDAAIAKAHKREKHFDAIDQLHINIKLADVAKAEREKKMVEEKKFDQKYEEAQVRADIANLRTKIQASEENAAWDHQIATAHDGKEPRPHKDTELPTEFPLDIKYLSQRVDTVLAKLPQDQQEQFQYELEEATRSVSAQETNSDDMDFSLGEDDVAPEAKLFEPSKTPKARDFDEKSSQLEEFLYNLSQKEQALGIDPTKALPPTEKMHPNDSANVDIIKNLRYLVLSEKIRGLSEVNRPLLENMMPRLNSLRETNPEQATSLLEKMETMVDRLQPQNQDPLAPMVSLEKDFDKNEEARKKSIEALPSLAPSEDLEPQKKGLFSSIAKGFKKFFGRN